MRSSINPFFFFFDFLFLFISFCTKQFGIFSFHPDLLRLPVIHLPGLEKINGLGRVCVCLCVE